MFFDVIKRKFVTPVSMNFPVQYLIKIQTIGVAKRHKSRCVPGGLINDFLLLRSRPRLATLRAAWVSQRICPILNKFFIDHNILSGNFSYSIGDGIAFSECMRPNFKLA
jgi:hypothetical protein